MVGRPIGGCLTPQEKEISKIIQKDQIATWKQNHIDAVRYYRKVYNDKQSAMKIIDSLDSDNIILMKSLIKQLQYCYIY